MSLPLQLHESQAFGMLSPPEQSLRLTAGSRTGHPESHPGLTFSRAFKPRLASASEKERNWRSGDEGIGVPTLAPCASCRQPCCEQLREPLAFLKLSLELHSPAHARRSSMTRRLTRWHCHRRPKHGSGTEARPRRWLWAQRNNHTGVMVGSCIHPGPALLGWKEDAPQGAALPCPCLPSARLWCSNCQSPPC